MKFTFDNIFGNSHLVIEVSRQIGLNMMKYYNHASSWPQVIHSYA
jgi:hypothetical protein